MESWIAPRSLLWGLFALAAVVATALLGSLWTARGVRDPRYPCLRPALTPPALVFPIAWTLLYALLFVQLWRALRSRRAGLVALLLASLALNVLWCYLYFGRWSVAEALSVLLALVCLGAGAVAVCATERDFLGAGLVAPYLAWLLFATALNALTLPRVSRCPA